MSTAPAALTTVIRQARIVSVGATATAGSTEPVDLLISDGRVTTVAPRVEVDRVDHVVDAVGRWAIPGL